MADDLIILGIKISKLSKEKVLDKISRFLQDDKQHYLVTPNAEIILNATKYDEELFYILNRADLAIADTISLKFAAWAMFNNIIRYTGADLVKDTLALAERENIKIAVLDWNKGLSRADDIEDALKIKYPKLKFFIDEIDRCGAYNFDAINKFAPAILYVTLGSPWQEKFIYHNLQNVPAVKIGLGIGGSFDYLTAKLPRAPKIMRLLGLEWLWRLVLQPSRWQRIYRAVIVFPYKFMIWRFILPNLYRPNLACLLYKRSNGYYKILIVERANDPGHWQLPQGGIDGDNLIKAGSRELREEINTDRFRPLTAYKSLHKYDFDEVLSKFGVLVRKTRGYKGQKQGVFIAEFLGEDSDIKVNFWEHSAWRWVDIDDVLSTVHPVRREAYKMYLEKLKEAINYGK